MFRRCWLVVVACSGLVLAGCGQHRESDGRAGGLARPSAAPAERYDFFEDWSGGIDPEKWRVGTWREHNMQTGHDRTYVEDGKLHLVFVNDSEQGMLGAAIQTQKEDFGYGRWEASLKPSNVPGVLNSMYTIDWRDGEGTRQEIDIEFLTYTFGKKHPGEMWIAQHARGRKTNDFSLPLDFNPSERFNVYGWDITPTHIDYLINGKVVYTYVYADHEITFDAPYMLKFNTWTNVPWIKGPPQENVKAVYQIDWIRFKAAE